MCKKIIIKLTRFILTFILLYCVYQETGPATTILSLLIMIAMELTCSTMDAHTNSIASIRKILTKILADA